MNAVPFAAILLSGIAAILIEQLWYSPRIFGAAWLRLTNVSPEEVERGRRRTWVSSLVGLLAAMLAAYAMALVDSAFAANTLAGAAFVGALCWVGFCAPALLTQVLWDQKPFALFLINAGYWLLSFFAIALILFYTAAL